MRMRAAEEEELGTSRQSWWGCREEWGGGEERQVKSLFSAPTNLTSLSFSHLALNGGTLPDQPALEAEAWGLGEVWDPLMLLIPTLCISSSKRQRAPVPKQWGLLTLRRSSGCRFPWSGQGHQRAVPDIQLCKEETSLLLYVWLL